MQLLPYDAQFSLIYRLRNGWIRRLFLVDVNAADYSYIEEIAYEKAQQGMQVDILPTLGNIDDPLRAAIFPDAIFAKSPDLRINGVLREVEQPTKVKLNTVKHSIDEAAAQANRVIINLKYPVDTPFMYRIATGRFKDHKNLEAIEFRYNGKYTLYKREQKKRQLLVRELPGTGASCAPVLQIYDFVTGEQLVTKSLIKSLLVLSNLALNKICYNEKNSLFS